MAVDLVWNHREGNLGPVHKSSDIFETTIFYPDSCGRGLKPICIPVSKRCGFGKRVHWFRVDERLIRVKKSAVQKIARFVSTWTNYV